MADLNTTDAAQPEEGHLVTPDGIRLVWRWDRAQEARGTVLIAHGFAEHMLRHSNDAAALVSAGFDVLRYDMRGHGRSGGKRAYVDRFHDYITDLHCMLGQAHEHGNGPVFLLGHSQGGLITTKALIDGPLAVRGVVLTNPALATKAAVPQWKKTAAKLFSRALPGFGLPTGLPASAISRDPESVREYVADPLIFSDATARWGWEFMEAQREAQASTLRVEVPLLVQLGTADGVIDSEFSRTWFADAQGDDITVTSWPGFYHEIYNEPEAERAKPLAELVAWLTERVPAE